MTSYYSCDRFGISGGSITFQYLPSYVVRIIDTVINALQGISIADITIVIIVALSYSIFPVMIDVRMHNELRLKFNPDGSELRRHQLELLSLLERFDSLCKENGIQYWLSSGTCLGAVRHEGFIPWDDDIDVEMLREDYLKFVEVFKEDDKYVLQTFDNDLFYTEPFPKLRSKKGSVSEGEFDGKYTFRGMFMDIFVLESSPKFIAQLCHLSFGCMRHFSFMINNNQFLVFLYKLWKSFNRELITTARCFTRNYHRNTLRHTLGTGLVNNVRVRDEIFPLKCVTFEGKQYPAPNNTDSYLRRMFGDYMRIPKNKHTHNLFASQENE